MLILALETKNCMNKLLLSDTFDHFSFIEGEITTFSKFTIDGYLQKDFYDEASLASLSDNQQYATWKEMREFCFSIIKGKRTPLNFKFIYALSKELTAKLLQDENLTYSLEDIQGLYLNFKYDGTLLQCTTGISMKLFTLDKSLERAWDKTTQQLFTEYGITFDQACTA
ncbi:MAG: DUF5721 family protein [Lachnospiraceae bacterium]